MSTGNNTGIGDWLFCLFGLLLLFWFKADIASDITKYAGFILIFFGALGLTLVAFTGRKKSRRHSSQEFYALRCPYFM